MATIAEVQAYIKANKVPKDIGIRMISKAEDFESPEAQVYHETPVSEGEKTPGFTDEFLPTALAKGLVKDPKGTIQSLNPALNLAKGVATSIINAKSGKANLDQIVSPTLESIPVLNSLVTPFKEIGAMSGGDKNAPGALLGSLANFALPFVPKGLKAVDASLGGHLGGMLKGVSEGAMNAQPRGLLSAPIHGAIKGLIKGVNEPGPVSNPIDRLASGSDMLSQANAEPDAAENPTGPIAGVRKGVSMNDMLKNIPEAPPKVSNIQQSKTAPQEIESALQSVKAPELDNPAQRALDMAERRLRIASDPKEVSDLNSRIEKLKDMVQRLQAHKEMEIF